MSKIINVLLKNKNVYKFVLIKKKKQQKQMTNSHIT